MVSSAKFLLFPLLIVGVYSVPIPSFFKLCGRKDPNFNACALKNAKEAIPHVIQGIKSLNIPNMTPLKIPFVALQSSENFKLNLTNLDVYGLEVAEPLSVKVDFNKREAEVILHIPKVQLKGAYSTDGRILILPIKGTGPGDLRFFDGDYTYKFNWEMFKKKGVDYGKIKSSKLTFDIKKAEFKMDNLFNGDKRLGNEMNKFLNENWKEVLSDFGPVIGKTVASLCDQIANNLFTRVPFDKLFLN